MGDTFQEFVLRMRAKYPLVDFYLSEEGERIVLNKLIVPAERRGQGIGTQFLRDLITYADRHGKTVTLTPSTAWGATSAARLRRFYRRFGFINNTGRNRRFEFTEAMYRLPLSRGRLVFDDQGGAAVGDKRPSKRH